MKTPQEVFALCTIIRDGGHIAYIVGGSVRDMLMGREPHDFDVATSATPERVMELFDRTIPTGIKYGTVTVLMGERPIEVTTFRTDQGGTDGRHPDSVLFGETIEGDLARRDFTMNAIAFNPLTGELVDPFGGAEDINGGVIRCVGNPDERFAEDGLRIMRAIRFSVTLDFYIEKGTYEAISRGIPTFKKVSVERLHDELLKMFQGVCPGTGIEDMRRTGLLHEVLPEVEALVGVQQNRFHKHDVYRHTLETLDAAPQHLRLAALLHDVGKLKAQAPSEGRPGEFSFHGHEDVGAEIAKDILQRLKFKGDDVDTTVHLIAQHCIYMGFEKLSDSGVRRLIKRVGTDHLTDSLALREADVMGQGRMSREEVLSESQTIKARLDEILSRPLVEKLSDLAIDGTKVMEVLGIPQGRRVGFALRALEQAVLDNPDLNTEEGLTKLLTTLSF